MRVPLLISSVHGEVKTFCSALRIWCFKLQINTNLDCTTDTSWRCSNTHASIYTAQSTRKMLNLNLPQHKHTATHPQHSQPACFGDVAAPESPSEITPAENTTQKESATQRGEKPHFILFIFERERAPTFCRHDSVVLFPQRTVRSSRWRLGRLIGKNRLPQR